MRFPQVTRLATDGARIMPESAHASWSGYNYWRCRCALCREFIRQNRKTCDDSRGPEKTYRSQKL